MSVALIMLNGVPQRCCDDCGESAAWVCYDVVDKDMVRINKAWLGRHLWCNKCLPASYGDAAETIILNKLNT